MIENFMAAVMASRAPMDKLASALLDYIEGQTDNANMAEILDQHVSRMPLYCRPGFMAVRACMRHGIGRAMRQDEVLDAVLDAPPALRWKLLVRMDKRISADNPALTGRVGPLKQRLIDAIAALPLRQRRLALENVKATDWEAQRAALVRQSLPEDLGEISAHLIAYLETFDPHQRLQQMVAFNILVPLANTILRRPCATTFPAAIKLLPVMAQRTADDEPTRSQVRSTFIAYQQKLPPKEKSLMAMLIAGLLLPDGEPKLMAFRLGLQELENLPPKSIGEILCALCKHGQGLPSYIFMGSLCALRAVMEKIPPAQRGDTNAAVFKLTETFGAPTAATAQRSLGFPHGAMYFH